MIESREQRKKSSLLRRRKMIIIISVILVLASGIALYFVNDYVNNVIPYVDTTDNTTYYIKCVNGVWKMYDKNGVLLTKEESFGYFVTESGTLVEVREDTGEYFTRAVPDISDGELTEYEKVLIFKHIETKNIRSIEVHNQVDSFTFMRYDIVNMQPNDSSDFVLRRSPLLTVKKDTLSSLAVAAGYPLATLRVDDVKLVDGKVDFSEYGLVAEERTKIETDENGNEQTVTYNYTPSYYILTTTSGEKYKMLIGDRLVNGGGYYAQYIEMTADGEKPREKVYVLGSSIGYSLLLEAKSYITPGIAYPVTQNDYYDVTDFTITKNLNGKKEKVVSFSYIDIEDRTGTVQGSRPYVFTDERSNAYQPNYDRIDTCLLAFMEPTIVDIAVLTPTSAQLSDPKYGLMKPVLDADGNPTYNENGTQKFVFDAPYTVSFKRTAKDNEGNLVEFLQTVYISNKNENGNYYSYTELTFLNNTSSSSISGINFHMICEVSADTFNFLTYDEFDWTYPYVLETGIKYVTNIKIETSDYSATFNVNNQKDGERNGISVIASDSNGKSADTFGLLSFTDVGGNKWIVGESDFTITMPNGEEGGHLGTKKGVNAIGQTVKYIEINDKSPYDYVTVNDGVISRVYIKLDEIKIDYVNGTSRTYVRHHTMIFKKLYQKINSLAIINDYPLTEAEEQALISDPTKYLATITLTNDQNVTTKVECYSIPNSNSKVYIVVNGEGGYYIHLSALQGIFANADNFFECKDIT